MAQNREEYTLGFISTFATAKPELQSFIAPSFKAGIKKNRMKWKNI
jgi:hypothetical protein